MMDNGGDYVHILKGEGTKECPYIIKTAEDLASVELYSADPSIDNFNRLPYFYQDNDIDLGDYGDWKPIRLRGNYNGNGHKIKNMKIRKAYGGLLIKCAGLFSEIELGVIKKVVLENIDIKISMEKSKTPMLYYVGGLCGAINRTDFIYPTKVSNCYIDGEITVLNPYGITNLGSAGGLIGNAGYGNVTYNCIADLNVFASALSVGGLIGLQTSLEYTTHCCSYGDVTSIDAGTSWSTGGLIGKIRHIDFPDSILSGAQIEYCFSTGNVKSSYGDTGGLIGKTPRTELKDFYIKNCYSIGKTVNERVTSLGGLVGLGNVHIKNCYVSGDIQFHDYFNDHNPAVSTGGIIGEIIDYNLENKISNPDLFVNSIRLGGTMTFYNDKKSNKITGFGDIHGTVGTRRHPTKHKDVYCTDDFSFHNIEHFYPTYEGDELNAEEYITTTMAKRKSFYEGLGWEFSEKKWKYDGGYPYIDIKLDLKKEDYDFSNFQKIYNTKSNALSEIEIVKY